ncbi:MurR/RpiR family transcriptional regulator [Reinekea sp.]|jgi:RpiR family carbohydrate utilization transcriptional regulator|uniref:MurR/RpiR family transcriptional regulator n=1 Tax=Reinekea sp. TaxID=1970455 RepID=UPI003988DA73
MRSQPKVLAQLLSNTVGLSPALERIAKYVKKAPETVIYQTITELSENAKSSEASVIRFCRDIGFSSYADFKMALAIELNSQKGELSENGNHGGLASTPLPSANETISALAATAELIECDDIKQCADWIAHAKSVDIYGVGASSIIANYAEYRMLRLGITSRAFSDMHLGLMSAVKRGKRDVVICISSSGSTVDIVKAAKLAQENGARVIGISNTRKSPLAKEADSLLVASSPESPLTAGNLSSKAGQLLLIDVIMTDIFKRNSKYALSHQETADATSGLLY